MGTRNWYNKHGIPYKRSYIFYGPPGTGKTSFIQALAGAYGRNVCFLQPNDPKFTDDAFKTCLQRAPQNSIIVLEDIDALFNDRNSMNKSCPLTFTGLLNGLDGIGNALGQLFVLSTNHLDRLDPALIRSGRVDRKFEFYCTDEALALMFKRFYPVTKVADQFAAAIRANRPSSKTCTTPTSKWWSTWKGGGTRMLKRAKPKLKRVGPQAEKGAGNPGLEKATQARGRGKG